MKFIVTAGGQGTKVWPMSREDKPKQFQNLVGEETLFRTQINSLLKAYSPKDIFISTKKRYLKYINKQASEIPTENIILEPDFKKNRGPGEGYAFLKLAEVYPNEPFMIIQSDVLRSPENQFLEFIEETEKIQKKERKLITSGQKAIYPDMGSDYISLGKKYEGSTSLDMYKVDKFIDRLGDYQKTKDLIENFHVSTHTNHLCWYPELMLEAYKKYRPDWHESLIKIRETFGKEKEEELTSEIYEQMEEGATEEVTKHEMQNGYLILNPFKWTDVGTWSSIYDSLSQYGKNYIDAEVVNIDTKTSLVKGKKGKLIATIGVEDLIIVDTEDALLVCSKDRAGDVKAILKNLEESGREEWV